MINNETDKKNKVIFPEDTIDIIESLLEKVGLTTISELFESDLTDEEFKEKWENDPGSHIAQILKEYGQGKIKDESALIASLRDRLNIADEKAQELARELQEKIISQIQSAPEKAEIDEEIDDLPKEQPSYSEKPDVYREPIE